MGRWDPLTEFLAASNEDRLVLTLDEIAEILGRPVPASARTHPPFWSNGDTNSYSKVWRSAGYRTTRRGLPADQVAFIRSDLRLESEALPVAATASATVVLVACVKTKAQTPRRAKDLYLSELFQRRRGYAQASGLPWFVLSALHGAVAPDRVLEPYDVYLEDEPSEYRDAWGQRVVDALEREVGSLAGHVIEIHASSAYVEPIRQRLTERGAQVSWPFEGRRFGEHLSWYGGVEARGRPSTGAGPNRTARDRLIGSNAHQGLAWQISDAFMRETLDLSARADAPAPGWSGMPELAAVVSLRDAGADEATVRLFCTFVMAMDRARDADHLWRRSAELFQSAPWVYDPGGIAARSHTDLMRALRSAGVTQRHLPDSAAWRVIAESLLHRDTAPEVHTVVYDGAGDAVVLLDAVTRTTPEGIPLFPLLQGPKIAPVWLRIIAYPGGAQLSSMEQVPVGVDVQVRKVSEYLDIARTAGLPLDEIRSFLQRLWDEDVSLHGAAGPNELAGTPAAVDPAVWFYGKWGCTRCERAGEKRPISPICDACRFDAVRQRPGK